MGIRFHDAFWLDNGNLFRHGTHDRAQTGNRDANEFNLRRYYFTTPRRFKSRSMISSSFVCAAFNGFRSILRAFFFFSFVDFMCRFTLAISLGRPRCTKPTGRLPSLEPTDTYTTRAEKRHQNLWVLHGRARQAKRKAARSNSAPPSLCISTSPPWPDIRVLLDPILNPINRLIEFVQRSVELAHSLPNK